MKIFDHENLELYGSNGNHFLANIRKYDCAFLMTSFGCNEVSMSGISPLFRIQGQVYHIISSTIPTEGASSKFTQIYFIDSQVREVDAPKTTLTEFFALCQVDDFAKTLLYVDA